MAVIPWRAPGPTDPDMAFLLVQINKAQETLDAAVAAAQNLPDTDPSRASRLLRYTALQREVERTYAEVTRLARGWATTDVTSMYAQGHVAAALQLRVPANFTLAHKDAISVIVNDAYTDVANGLQQVPRVFAVKLAAQRQLELLAADRRALIQTAGRDVIAQQLILGELSPAEAARLLRDQLWKNGVEVIDRTGRQWHPESYARMLVRTKSANAFNTGTLNKSRQEGVSRVLVFDGVQDSHCAQANGQTWTLDYAYSHVIAHPNCRRAFAPVPGRGLLHRATLEEVGRLAGVTFLDELLISSAFRVIRHWDAVGQIEFVPRPLRRALDHYGAFPTLLERTTALENWATDRFMPLVHDVAELSIPGVAAKVGNLAVERLERRALPVRREVNQLMADQPRPALVTDPQSQAAISAAATVRDAIGREPTSGTFDSIVSSALGQHGDDVEAALQAYLSKHLLPDELIDELASLDDGMELANELSDLSPDTVRFLSRHMTVTTMLEGGANGSIPVVTIDGVEWIVKFFNGNVEDPWRAFVAEEWTTFMARKLDLPRVDSALVRIDDLGFSGVLVQRRAEGWSSPAQMVLGRDYSFIGQALDTVVVGERARRQSILNLIVRHTDDHSGNWLISARRNATLDELRTAEIMPIDMELSFGGWRTTPSPPSLPARGMADFRRSSTRNAADYDFPTITLTADDDAFLRQLLRGEHDDELLRLADQIPGDDAANILPRYQDATLFPDKPWHFALTLRLQEIKQQIERAYVLGYVDDGTRVFEDFAGRTVRLGEDHTFKLNPRGDLDPWRVGTLQPDLLEARGKIRAMYQAEDGTRWLTVEDAHQRLATFRESDVQGSFARVTRRERIELSNPLQLDPDELVFPPTRHDWSPAVPDFVSPQNAESGLRELRFRLNDSVRLNLIPRELQPTEVRFGRVVVDGVDVPGAYHPMASGDATLLSELAKPGGVVVNPEGLVDGLEGFWRAWQDGKANRAGKVLDMTRLERVLRHELGHAIADRRRLQLAEQVQDVAFTQITESPGWLRSVVGEDVDLDVLRANPAALRAAVKLEVERYVEAVTTEVDVLLREEARRVLTERYSLADNADVLPDWLRYAGNVLLGRHGDLDPLREFEGDLFGHLLERAGKKHELTSLENLFLLRELPDLPTSRSQLDDIQEWIRDWYTENRLPSLGLQLMAEQTGLPRHRLRRITEFQDVPGDILDEGVLRRVYEHDFGEFKTAITSITPVGRSQTVIGALQLPDGTRIGTFNRVLDSSSVYHASLYIDSAYQGHGYGTQFFEWTEDWYVAKGLREIKVGTASVGGYNWARRGYDFEEDGTATYFLNPERVLGKAKRLAEDWKNDDVLPEARQLMFDVWMPSREFLDDVIDDEWAGDLYDFTQAVLEERFFTRNLTEADWTEMMFGERGVQSWSWHAITPETAQRARSRYQTLSSREDFTPTPISEMLRMAGMGAVPVPTDRSAVVYLSDLDEVFEAAHGESMPVLHLQNGDPLIGPLRAFIDVVDRAEPMIEAEWTAFRVSQLLSYVQVDTTTGRATHLGKELMLNSSWNGIKPLEPLRREWHTEIFRTLNAREVADTTTAAQFVNPRDDVVEVMNLLEDMTARTRTLGSELLVVPYIPSNALEPIPRTWEIFERISDEVKELGTVFAETIEDAVESAWRLAASMRRVRRQDYFDTRSWYEREVLDVGVWETKAGVFGGAIVENPDAWDDLEQVGRRLVRIISDDRTTLDELGRALEEAYNLIGAGVPGFGTAIDYVGTLDKLRTVQGFIHFVRSSNPSAHVGDALQPTLRVEIPGTMLNPPADWARGTLIEDYAGATTYFAINSQLRRERGIHNTALAFLRRLREQYDAGDPYRYPGWELTFRQTSLPLSHWEQFVGGEFISEAYMSTATTPATIGFFAAGSQEEARRVLLMVRLPEELQGQVRFVNAGESEVLFPPGSRFAVRTVVPAVVTHRGQVNLVVMDYLSTASRDVPAFGGWQAVRQDFQYVSNLRRGDSVRYRIRASEPWEEAVVIGVTDYDVSLVKYESRNEGIDVGYPFNLRWAEIFHMDRALPIDVDPPTATIADGYEELTRRQFLNRFIHTDHETAMRNRLAYRVRLELQTGEVLDTRLMRFAGGANEDVLYTADGILQTRSVRRFLVATSATPAPPEYAGELSQTVRNLLEEIRGGLRDVGFANDEVASNFRQLADYLDTLSPEVLGTWHPVNYTSNEMLLYALMGEPASVDNYDAAYNLLNESVALRDALWRLIRQLDREGPPFMGGSYILGSQLTTTLRRVAGLIELDDLPVPVAGGPQASVPVIADLKDFIKILNDDPVINVSLQHVADNLHDIAETVIDPSMTGEILPDSWIDMVTEWLPIHVDNEDAIEVGNALYRLFTSVEDELRDGLNGLDPATQAVVLRMKWLIDNADSVIQLPTVTATVPIAPTVIELANKLETQLVESGGLVFSDLLSALDEYIDDTQLALPIETASGSVPFTELIMDNLGISEDDVPELSAMLEDLIEEGNVDTVEELKELLTTLIPQLGDDVASIVPVAQALAIPQNVMEVIEAINVEALEIGVDFGTMVLFMEDVQASGAVEVDEIDGLISGAVELLGVDDDLIEGLEVALMELIGIAEAQGITTVQAFLDWLNLLKQDLP